MDCRRRELCTALAILTYSQTLAFSWDAGYHLLAAQLIAPGRTPYLDFCFPQAPLNAYWNALWMRILGGGWRIPQGLAALLHCRSDPADGRLCWGRFPVPEWRAAAATAAIVLAGSSGT